MSSDEEQTRDEIEEIVNDEPAVQEPVQEAVIETMLEEEEAKPVKAKPKAKKPKTKITKEPVEPIKDNIIKEPGPITEVEEKPKKIYKNKQMVNCQDCNLKMTQHTLKYIRKKEDIVKEHFKKKLKNKLTRSYKRATWLRFTEAETNKNNNNYYR